MEMINLIMQFCKEASMKKFQAEMGLEHLTCEIVLHTALLSELSIWQKPTTKNQHFWEGV